MFFNFVKKTGALLVISAVLISQSFAQQFPSKPIRILVGFGPVGTTDSVGRLYGQKMSEIFGVTVLIDNRPGGQQFPVIHALTASAPDGYTLYVATGSGLVQNPALRNNLPYNPLKDFSFVGMMVTNPGLIFINADLPVKTLNEFLAYVKANPNKVNYGTAGVGSAGHLHVEALMNMTGISMTQITYKSDADVIRETMSGNVHMGMMTTLNTTSFARSGKIRALAVQSTSRLAYLPDVPTLQETGIKGLADLAPHTFLGIVGPAGLPPAVLARLNETVNRISAMPEVITIVRDRLFSEPALSTPASFRAYVESEQLKWRPLQATVKLTD